MTLINQLEVTNKGENEMETYKPSEMLQYIIESDSVNGDVWFAHYDTFINIVESDEVAFGKTPQEALQNFIDSRVEASKKPS